MTDIEISDEKATNFARPLSPLYLYGNTSFVNNGPRFSGNLFWFPPNYGFINFTNLEPKSVRMRDVSFLENAFPRFSLSIFIFIHNSFNKNQQFFEPLFSQESGFDLMINRMGSVKFCLHYNCIESPPFFNVTEKWLFLSFYGNESAVGIFATDQISSFELNFAIDNFLKWKLDFTTGDLQIGSSENASFDGELACLSLYSVMLSQYDIQELNEACQFTMGAIESWTSLSPLLSNLIIMLISRCYPVRQCKRRLFFLAFI